MVRHAWAASLMPVSAHAFDVAVGDGSIIRFDTPSTIIIAQHHSTPLNVSHPAVRPDERNGAVLPAEGGTQHRVGAVRIVGTNKRSTPANKMYATLRVDHHKTGPATQSVGNASRPRVGRIHMAAVRRSHLASTTTVSRVR